MATRQMQQVVTCVPENVSAQAAAVTLRSQPSEQISEPLQGDDDDDDGLTQADSTIPDQEAAYFDSGSSTSRAGSR